MASLRRSFIIAYVFLTFVRESGRALSLVFRFRPPAHTHLPQRIYGLRGLTDPVTCVCVSCVYTEHACGLELDLPEDEIRGEKTALRVGHLAAASSPPAVKRSPERRRGSSKKARIGARHCSGRPRVNRKGWLTAPKQTQSSRRGTAAATPAAAATLFASRAGRRCRS